MRDSLTTSFSCSSSSSGTFWVFLGGRSQVIPGCCFLPPPSGLCDCPCIPSFCLPILLLPLFSEGKLIQEPQQSSQDSPHSLPYQGGISFPEFHLHTFSSSMAFPSGALVGMGCYANAWVASKAEYLAFLASMLVGGLST